MRLRRQRLWLACLITAAGSLRIADEAHQPPDTWSESDRSFLRRLGYVPLEETRNNPIPFLILAAVVGLLLGSWWIGLLVGIGVTIIPGVALLALLINNLVIGFPLKLLMVVGYPFFLAYRGIRRVAPHKTATNADRSMEG